MGAGKTTVGKILAKKLGKHFYDIDNEIEKSENREIKNIFSDYGEEYFRDLETEMLTKICSNISNSVISTGGGVVIRDINLKIMKSCGEIIYLKAEIDTLWSRVKNSKNRPLLNVDSAYEKAKKLFNDRKNLYEKADYLIETDNLSLNEIVNKIIDKNNKNI